MEETIPIQLEPALQALQMDAVQALAVILSLVQALEQIPAREAALPLA